MLATDLKVGIIYKEDNQPFVVTRYEHTKTARGGATIKVKARNLITGQLVEKRYISSTKVEYADVMRKNAQYLYSEVISNDTKFVFMDPETYEQFSLSQDEIGDSSIFLMEGGSVQVLYFEDQPVSIELPTNLVFEVTYTEPGFKGNTVTNALKDAQLENGAKVKVPPFIKIGDKVRVDTRTGDYVSKA